MTKRTLADGSPVYDSWDEALADPDLDLSRPWHIAYEPTPADRPPPVTFIGWPPGWMRLGYIDETPPPVLRGSEGA